MTQQALQSALRDVQGTADTHDAHVKAWSVLRDAVRADVGPDAVRELFRECVQAPSEAAFGTSLALKPQLHNETAPKAVAAEILRLDIALQLAPAASELLEFEQRGKAAKPTSRPSVVIEELDSAHHEALEVASVLLGMNARCTVLGISVPWADGSTDVRAQQLLQQLADQTAASTEASRCEHR